MCKIKFAQEAGCKQAVTRRRTRGAELGGSGRSSSSTGQVAAARWRRGSGARVVGPLVGRTGRQLGSQAARQAAVAYKERFSKWVLECKWNNDKLKRQAEVLAGRNGRRRRWQRVVGSELC